MCRFQVFAVTVGNPGMLIECKAVKLEQADMQLVFAHISNTALMFTVDHRLAFKQMSLERADFVHGYTAEPGVSLDDDDQVPGGFPGGVVEQAVIGFRHLGCCYMPTDTPLYHA